MHSPFTLLMMSVTLSSQTGGGQWLPFLPEWLEIAIFLFAIIFVPVGLVILFVGMWRKVLFTIWYVISLQPWRRALLRRHLAAGLEYYRDIPANGNLKVANAVMNSISSAWITDYSGFFGALILRLIDKDALRMEWKSTMYGTEPHAVLSINEKSTSQNMSDTEWGFFCLMKGAAGADGTLQPRELQQYIRHNDVPFFKEITMLKDKEKELAKDPDTPRQLLGLRKYLLDFSLIGEREIKEMKLWKEYLVYATLFGIADKVCDNFATVYPDYFRMNSLAGTRLNIVGNNALVSYISATMWGMKKKDGKER